MSENKVPLNASLLPDCVLMVEILTELESDHIVVSVEDLGPNEQVHCSHNDDDQETEC